MAQPLPAGMSQALCGKCSAPSPGNSKVHVAGLNCVQITSLLYCVKDNDLPKELLLAFIKAMHTSSNTHQQVRSAVSHLLTEVRQQ